MWISKFLFQNKLLVQFSQSCLKFFNEVGYESKHNFTWVLSDWASLWVHMLAASWIYWSFFSFFVSFLVFRRHSWWGLPLLGTLIEAGPSQWGSVAVTTPLSPECSAFCHCLQGQHWVALQVTCARHSQAAQRLVLQKMDILRNVLYFTFPFRSPISVCFLLDKGIRPGESKHLSVIVISILVLNASTVSQWSVLIVPVCYLSSPLYNITYCLDNCLLYLYYLLTSC